ncbi:MAG TPA: immunoglobulin domain-containing protein [Verrucomicrobiae bacterium]|nr:immunoglobulin domain-containing protein [Verrucomicrobiae bacterium]
MKIALSFSGWWRKGVLTVSALCCAHFSSAQVLMSGGTYSQNFDSLASSGSPAWVDNSTLPGWYAAKGSAEATTYMPGTGTSFAGSIYSFGTNGVNPLSDRALGSIASSGNAYAYGVRLVNDTAFAQTNITVSYTGEQWRDANGANATVNTLAFSYQISDSPLTSADAVNLQTWTSFSALNFNSPVVDVGGGGTALDGNASANRQVFTDIVLTGAVVQPGQEIFLRWRDTDDSGSDAGIAVDDLTVSFQATIAGPPPDTNAPAITSQPQNSAAGIGGFAIFSASATGNPAPDFQWQFNGTNLPGETTATLTLNNVTTNQAGNYSLIVSNSAGVAVSDSATLLVTPVSFDTTNGEIRVLQYNVEGNGATDWTTNATQVQAIGRQLIYLNPDIITFNEIPSANGIAQMTNWVKAFLPGYYLATNSIGDSFIQNVVVSRFPITRSMSHLHASSLAPFGYSGSGFTRDLFEAQIAVPNWPLPLHVFVAHLKSTTSSPQDDANKRAAEASAVSNYFTTVFLPGSTGTHPYILDGDMNEDAYFPDSDYASGHPIQWLVSAPTGLQMTIPINSVTHTDLTESIQSSLDTRFDYILPCAMLFSNIAGSAVFRTDLLNPLPPGLNANDDKTSSDHLPVLMVFKNPFDTPFELLSVGVTNEIISLQWEAQTNRSFNIETSSDLVNWSLFATNIYTTSNTFTFTTNVSGNPQFFRVYRLP